MIEGRRIGSFHQEAAARIRIRCGSCALRRQLELRRFAVGGLFLASAECVKASFVQVRTPRRVPYGGKCFAEHASGSGYSGCQRTRSKSAIKCVNITSIDLLSTIPSADGCFGRLLRLRLLLRSLLLLRLRLLLRSLILLRSHSAWKAAGECGLPRPGAGHRSP